MRDYEYKYTCTGACRPATHLHCQITLLWEQQTAARRNRSSPAEKSPEGCARLLNVAPCRYEEDGLFSTGSLNTANKITVAHPTPSCPPHRDHLALAGLVCTEAGPKDGLCKGIRVLALVHTPARERPSCEMQVTRTEFLLGAMCRRQGGQVAALIQELIWHRSPATIHSCPCQHLIHQQLTITVHQKSNDHP